MSITVNVIGQTNIVTSITNSDTVEVGVGTFVAQAVTGLLVAAAPIALAWKLRPDWRPWNRLH